jgi:hypothetical protein
VNESKALDRAITHHCFGCWLFKVLEYDVPDDLRGVFAQVIFYCQVKMIDTPVHRVSEGQMNHSFMVMASWQAPAVLSSQEAQMNTVEPSFHTTQRMAVLNQKEEQVSYYCGKTEEGDCAFLDSNSRCPLTSACRPRDLAHPARLCTQTCRFAIADLTGRD